MNLCSDDHEEVCYEGRKCPVCEVRDELRHEIESLSELLEQAQGELNSNGEQ